MQATCILSDAEAPHSPGSAACTEHHFVRRDVCFAVLSKKIAIQRFYLSQKRAVQKENNVT